MQVLGMLGGGDAGAPAPESQPEPAPEAAAPTVTLFGRPVKLYDPEFAPTAFVLRMIERMRG